MMLRNFTKSAFACAYTLAGKGRPAASSAPFIVGYHRVVENFGRSARHAIPSLLISMRMLEKHIDWIAQRFQLLSLDEIGQALEAGAPFRRPTAAITFDDGYSDFYWNAYPLFKRKGIPAAVFVVTDVVGTAQPPIHDRLYFLLSRSKKHKDPLACMTGLLCTHTRDQIERMVRELEQQYLMDGTVAEEMAPLTWSMIQEMHANGITIGSHTKSHVLLTLENLDRVHNELTGSRQVLSERLGTPVKHFSYPDGRFNPLITTAVKAAGYSFAYSICREADRKYPLLTIPRKVLWERSCVNAIGRFSSAVMNCQSRWVFDGGRNCGHDHQVRSKNDTIN
jgi:peptidoglycan/xylan/chitin deacetylase (PgdA/CDA1 family)